MGKEGNYSPLRPPPTPPKNACVADYGSEGRFNRLSSLFSKTKVVVVSTYPLQVLLGLVVGIFSLAFLERLIPPVILARDIL